MKKLQELINNPENVSSQDISELQEVATKYPYFQAVHTLIAKAEPSVENVNEAALRTIDRTVLKKVITGANSGTSQLAEMPIFDTEEEVNAFDKLSENDTENKETVDFSEDAIVSEENTTTESVVVKEEENSVSEEENSKELFEETSYEHPEYDADKETAEESSVAKIEEMEEIDIAKMDDYDDPDEALRNELMETLAAFEKNKENIPDEYRFDKKTEEKEIASEEKETEKTAEPISAMSHQKEEKSSNDSSELQSLLDDDDDEDVETTAPKSESKASRKEEITETVIVETASPKEIIKDEIKVEEKVTNPKVELEKEEKPEIPTIEPTTQNNDNFVLDNSLFDLNDLLNDDEDSVKPKKKKEKKKKRRKSEDS